jgi:hypothetical protein
MLFYGCRKLNSMSGMKGEQMMTNSESRNGATFFFKLLLPFQAFRRPHNGADRY